MKELLKEYTDLFCDFLRIQLLDETKDKLIDEFINSKQILMKSEYKIDDTVITPEIIEKTVLNEYNLTIEQLKRKTRKREIVECRYIIMFFYNEMLKMPLRETAGRFSLDHSTADHGKKAVLNWIETDKNFNWKIEKLRISISTRMNAISDIIHETTA